MDVPEYNDLLDVSTPEERDNLEVVRGLYDEVVNSRNIDAVEKFVSAGLVQHNPLFGQDADGFQAAFQQLLTDFPDLRIDIQAAVAQNNRVMTITTWHGHKADTGMELNLDVADVYRVWDGKLVEHWDQTDYTVLEKFGIPRPEVNQPSDPVDKTGTPIQLMNLARLRQYMEEVTIADLSRAHLYVADDFVQHTDDVDSGLDGFKRCFEAFSLIAPDLEVVSTCIVAGTHSVGAIWTGIGHNPQTGDKFVLPTADIYRMEYGMLTEHWGLVDYTFPKRMLGFHPLEMLKTPPSRT
jgi:predicted SnoaL-like aldol condensation-catalyzing enzyme